MAKTLPLFKHGTSYKRWAKKIRGRHHYFGSVRDDPHGKKAMALWLQQRDDLLAGRVPRARTGTVEIRDVANGFLNAKRRAVAARELKQESFGEYYVLCQMVIKFFGNRRAVEDLVAADFAELREELAKHYAPAGLGKRISAVRAMFRHAYDNADIPNMPRFGTEFVGPSARLLRKVRAENGERILSAEEIRRVLAVADPIMKAAILLGVNAAFGNTDVACVPTTAIDFDKQVVAFPRPKTAIPRRAFLWDETTEALKQAITLRPEPLNPDDTGLVFLSPRGYRMVRYTPKENGRGTIANTVGTRFDKLLERIGVDRPGVSFYALRHAFRTAADDLFDRPAVDTVMGHSDSRDMRNAYVASIGDSRLMAVAVHVHHWLFGDTIVSPA